MLIIPESGVEMEVFTAFHERFCGIVTGVPNLLSWYYPAAIHMVNVPSFVLALSLSLSFTVQHLFHSSQKKKALLVSHL
ncbi:hypothetical protein, unlikely [Trypanosoma brucei brucei TREU927]|uniref:Uncharacterized protein n=1 Tax=Trypanosoma brucei brucei (strain 927/4 GUTat10.1) TaxID=185431 RepID=Q38E41_TRYB2|nr:hypothetical protein, unlikely [Trypanosoma brucei brucei TREU927]EAN76929.1 hypothetical protein, unlikely [Trypanosoma brucei brucei TREU927]